MNKVFFQILFFVSFICFSQNENNEYPTFKYKKILFDNYGNNKTSYLKQVISSIPETEYELIIGDSVSRFSILEKNYTDGFNKGAIKWGGGETFYYKKEENNYYVFKKVESFDGKFLVKDSINDTKWDVTNEIKKIQNFTCYKAIAKKNVYVVGLDKSGDKPALKKEVKTIEMIAWFCPEFPYSFGPDIFYGLPGIVFEGYQIDGKVSFVLDSIIFKKNNDDKITIPELKITNEADFIDKSLKKMNSKNF
ncbi:GLPGLI family protein [Flavobacterium sp. HNIBRBA15423]|uniref:GLPGLI family protein n=1 Tax=Flavobacterium sp. HNIBRBA15423 TaxID=3458683 RepID=UPI004044E185